MTQSLADKLLPTRLKVDVARILKDNNHRRAKLGHDGRVGAASFATQHERESIVLLCFAQLWEMGYRLKAAKSLGERHVRVLAERWSQEGLAAGTINTRVSYLSTFAAWIGKKGMVGSPADYCGKERVARSHIADRNKSWPANGKSPEEVIALARQIDERLALYLTLQHTLGLRVKESLEFRPLVSLADDGVTVEIFEGTKGGRRRSVMLDTEAKRQAMAWAMEVAKETRGGRLRWAGLTFKQARRRFHDLMERKLGITRRESGVTAHGLRHGFAQEHYRRQSGGLPTPIEGGAIGAIDRETHARAGMSTSKALGHCRVSITGAYCGSYGHGFRNAVVMVKPMTLSLDPIMRCV